MPKTETRLMFVPEGTKGQDLISLRGREERFQAREVPWRLYTINSARGPFDISSNRIFAASRRPGRGRWDTYASTKGILDELKAHKNFQIKNTHLARQKPKVGGELDPFWLNEAYIFLNWHVYKPQSNVLLSGVQGTPSVADLLQEALTIGVKLFRQAAGPIVFSITGHKEPDSIARIECTPTVSMEQIHTFLMTIGNLNLFNKDKVLDFGEFLKGGKISDAVQ